MKNLKYLLGIVAMAFALVASAQSKRFSATVVDELGEPMIGASVIVKGTTQGVMTSIDGSFSIDVPEGAEVEISYIGYVTQTLTNFSTTQITLVEDRQQIEEVVVVGYGTQKKSHLTGSVATVPVDDIQDLSAGDVASSLRGLVNGLNIEGGQSRPGESGRIFVRGSDNLGDIGSTAQEPLYVIDGYIYPNDVEGYNGSSKNLGAEAFNNLDPSSIESISVLKDASAAVYGSRAANGVILVTTKRGKQGAPQISYNGSVGIADSFSQPKMLNAYQYGRLWNAVKAADPMNDITLNRTYDLFQRDELEAMKSLDYNLLDKYWSSAITHKHSLNLTGATEKVNYFAGVSYFDQDGNLGKLDYNRWTYRAGVDAKIGNNLKIGVSVTGDYGNKTQPYIKVGSGDEKDYRTLLTHPRYIPEYVNGYPVAAYGVSNDQIDERQEYHFNELQNLGDYTNSQSTNLNIGANIEYDLSWIKPLKGLTARLSYSKSISTDKSNEVGSYYQLYRMAERTGSGMHLYTPLAGRQAEYDELVNNPDNFQLSNNGQVIANGGSGTDGTPGTLTRTMLRTDNYQLNFNVAYNRDFGKHHVGAFFSIERSESETEYLHGEIFGISNVNTSHQSNSGDNSSAAMRFDRSEAGTLSYIGRVNYAYDDKYLIELLLRSDASTKFAPENYWGTFPSLSAGWVISKENWFADNVSWVDFLKVRASAGLTGRDNITAWQWRKRYNNRVDKGPVFGTAAGSLAGSNIEDNSTTAAVNEDVHWDKSYKFNVGIDWNVLNNRLGFNIEYYRQWDREMLMNYSGSIPGIVGTSSADQNYGEMDSWGVEFSASWRDRVNEDFSYRIQLNTGYSDNKVRMMDFDVNNHSYYTMIQPGSRTDTGLWGMQCIGTFRSFQEIEEYVTANNITSYMGMSPSQIRPGMLIYKDVGSYDPVTGQHTNIPDGIVNSTDDKVRISNRASNPYGLSANLGFDWKGLSVTAQLSASWGSYMFVPSSAVKVGFEGNIDQSLEYTNAPSFWNPDNMFVYQDITDGAGNVVVAANHNAKYPSLAYSQNFEGSTFWRISGAQVSLNRLTVAYTLPKKWTNAIGISSCRVNVTGQNLFYFNNPFPDNFTNFFNTNYSYPRLRRFTLGLNLTF